LDRAEKSYSDRTYDVARDEGYIATRKAQLAESHANAELAAAEKAKLENDLEIALKRQRWRPEQADAAAVAAETAAQKLAGIVSVTREERGTVLILPGNIVFASGQYKLRPDSLSKLNLVAATLKELGGQTFIVEGYTDSTGSDAVNQQLSIKRAQTVRGYLIRRGLQPDQVKAVGRGKERPIAPNDTPEGRAQNRRVEIIVQAYSS